MDKNCDNCINSGRPSYEWPCTSCTSAYGSAPSKWESIVAKDTNVPSWIPVSERLPRPNKLVLCWWESGDGEKEHYGFATFQSHGVWYVSNEGMPKVTHWMPLPEPPKEE